MIRIRLLLCFILLPAGLVYAQNFKSPVRDLHDYRFQSINEQQGLYNMHLGEIAQDSLGFIWIASEEGLQRFDGSSFRIYKSQGGSRASVLSNWIIALACDRKGRLWISYQGGGFSIYDPLTELFRHFPPGKDGVNNSTITTFFMDSDGDTWISMYPDEMALFRKNAETIEPVVADSVATGKSAFELAYFKEDVKQKGKIWISSNGLFSYDKRSGKWSKHTPQSRAIPFPDHHEYTMMLQLPDQRLVLSSWGLGITLYNPVTRKTERHLPEGETRVMGTANILYWMAPRDEKSVWISSSIGFGYFDCDEKVFYALDSYTREKYAIPKGNLGRVFRDRDHNVWIAHAQGLSLLKHNFRRFQFRAIPVSFSDNGDFYYVQKVFRDTLRKKTLIGLGFGDGLQIHDDLTGEVNRYRLGYLPDEENSEMVEDIARDSAGTIWILSRDFFYRFNWQKNQPERIRLPSPYESSKKSVYFRQLIYTGGDSLWISTGNAGLLCYHFNENKFSRYRHEPGDSNSLSSDYIGHMHMDASGRLWLRTRRKTIDIFNVRTHTMQHLRAEQVQGASPRLDFFSFDLDSKGRMWVSGSEGLFYADTRREAAVVLNTLSGYEGISTRFFTQLAVDREDALWTTSPNGVYRIHPAQVRIERYNSADGLGSDYIGLNLDAGQEGNIFFYYWKGFYNVSPNPGSSARRLQPYLSAVRLMGKEIHQGIKAGAGDFVQFNPNENYLSFDITAVDFLNPDKLLFSYRLDGLNEEWSAPSNRRYATFSNLPGGKYRLLVKVSGNEGQWSPETELYRFEIATPIWRRTWFVTIMSLMLAGLIFLLYRYRIYRIQRSEAYKTELNKRLAEAEMRALRAQMNPHFIFNSLNSINRYIVKSDQQTASLYLTRFSKLMRLILDNSNNKSVSLEQDLEALRIYIEMELLRFENRFEYSIDISPGTDTFSIQVPPMILQPFVENAIWHGLLHKETKGRLQIRISQKQNVLICEIEDDGVGRQKAKEFKSKTATTRKSLGMQLTEERVQLLKAELGGEALIQINDLVDAAGEPCGTLVTLHLPIEN